MASVWQFSFLKPAAQGEYCLAWIDWWATCMTKSEWSGWAQAFGAAISLAVAIYLASRDSRARHREDMARANAMRPQVLLHIRSAARDLRALRKAIVDLSKSGFLRRNGDPSILHRWSDISFPPPDFMVGIAILPGVSEGIGDAQSVVLRMERAVDELAGAGGSSASFEERAQQLIEDVDSALGCLRDANFFVTPLPLNRRKRLNLFLKTFKRRKKLMKQWEADQKDLKALDDDSTSSR